MSGKRENIDILLEKIDFMIKEVDTNKGIARVVPEGRYVEIHEDKKMIYVDRNGIPCNWEFGYYVWSNEITKHSKNIIDLIEVGDIVIVKNGLGEEELIFIDNEDKKHIVRTHKIKSIVTKEQFKEMEYRVE